MSNPYEGIQLSGLPDDPRARELWMQHAVGFMLMREVRDSTRDEILRGTAPEQQEAALSAVDITLYNLCRLIEGVSPSFRNDQHRFTVDLVGQLRDDDFTIIDQFPMSDGDGICMGIWGWMDGNFGDEETRPFTEA